MPEGWLVGWKSISKYVHMDRQTIKRLQKECGMPIRMLPSGTHVALSAELDAWLIHFTEDITVKRKSNLF